MSAVIRPQQSGLGAEILAIVPVHGRPLRDVWLRFKKRPAQAIEGALHALLRSGDIRIFNDIISPLRLAAMPNSPELAPKPRLEIDPKKAKQRCVLNTLLVQERGRFEVECRALRADRSLNTAECVIALREVQLAYEQRLRELRQVHKA